MLSDGLNPIWDGAEGDRGGLGVDRVGTPVDWFCVNMTLKCIETLIGVANISLYASTILSTFFCYIEGFYVEVVYVAVIFHSPLE